MRKFGILLITVTAALSGCAGPNPNPGERTTDIAWTSGNYEQAFQVVEPHAKKGKPWAQLRLGVFYHNGWGVEQDLNKAADYYQKAMVQRADDGWSNGRMIGAMGESGYFNQNSDAIIAEYNLASLYYETKEVDGNLVKAFTHASNVVSDSKGRHIFFCCEFAGGRAFTYEMFVDLANKVKSELSEEQLKQIESSPEQ